MVNQKSDGFRSLTGFHGGLRRGTAAAAFGAVLVLSAGVPASHAASELPASELPRDSEQSGTAAGTGLEATVDAAGLKAWAAAALSNEGDSPAEPAPSPSPSASLPPSLAPLVPTPAPSMTMSASPTPAVPVPSPSDPVPLPSVPVPTIPVPTEPVQIAPVPSPAPTTSGTPAPSRSAAPAPSSAETSSSGTQSPSETATPSSGGGSWTGPSAGTGGSSPAGEAYGSLQPGSPSPAAAGAEGSAAAAETPSADASRFAAITGLSGGAGLRGRSAAGVAAGVWGSAELTGPNNMATISSRYMRGPAEGAVMGVSQNGSIAPQVWWGAGLLALAGAAGAAAVRLRRAL